MMIAILGIIAILASIIIKNLIFLSIATFFSLLPAFATRKRKILLSSIIVLSFLPVIAAPTNVILLTNTMKLIIRFMGIFYLADFTNKSISKMKLEYMNSPIFYSVYMAMNLLPHLENFLKSSFNQLRLKNKYIFLIPSYLIFLLHYLSNYAENLGWEIEIFLREKNG